MPHQKINDYKETAIENYFSILNPSLHLHFAYILSNIKMKGVREGSKGNRRFPLKIEYTL
jgi:hypothetical protein